jgi:serine/threonine protein kinase
MSSTRIIIQNRFRIDGRLNQGAFGVIYKGTDLTTGKKVAIKFESTFTEQPQLAYEYKLYTFLAQNVPEDELIGIPKVYGFGIDSSFYFLVLDLLGLSLEDLFTICNKRFTLKTTLMLIDQMLARVEFVHSKSYLHRDIKPDNFVIGLGSDQNIINLIDYGLAKRYRDPLTKQHVPYSEQCPLTGTIRYVSKSTHLGIEQSRRDDLESLGYIWVYFLKGVLPWQGIKKAVDKQRTDAIFQVKMQTTVANLCEKLPLEFQVYFEYLKSLGFYDKPDYSYLRNLFRNLMVKFGYKYDNVFDWTPALAGTNITKILPPTMVTNSPQKIDQNDQNDQNNENKITGGPLNPSTMVMNGNDYNDGKALSHDPYPEGLPQ